MRIVHAHKFFYLRGGAERYMLELMRMQREAGHECAPFAMHHPENDASEWSKHFASELDTTRVARGWGRLRQLGRAVWSVEAARKMDALLGEFRPDVCHAHNLFTHLSPSVLHACRRRGVPVVLTLHDYGLVSANYGLWDRDRPMDLDRRGLIATARTRFIKGSFAATLTLELVSRLHRGLRAWDRHIDRYLAISEFMKDVAVRGGIPSSKITVIHNFVLVGREPRRVETEPYVLVYGRLDEYKGVQTVVDAMRRLPDTTLKIAGTGPYEAALRARAAGVDNVELLGRLSGDRLWEAVGNATVVVVPSLWHEPFGLVVTEAMACGVPVVVSDRGALPEIVEDGVSGRVFSAGDAGQLARVLAEIVADPDWVARAGQAARARAEQLSSPERHLARVLGEYRGVIDARSSRG